MKVRGWLIVGGFEAMRSLLPEAEDGPMYAGQMPEASAHEPGRWIVWQSSPQALPVVLVCVDVPLA